MNKTTSFTRIEEILATVNTNVIEEILIQPGSSHIPIRFDWLNIVIGTRDYTVWLADIDPRYNEDGISLIKDILLKFDLPYVCEDYEYTLSHLSETRIFNLKV